MIKNCVNRLPVYYLTGVIYSTIRKPFVLKNYKVESQKDRYLHDVTYRELLYSEIIPITFISGVLGMVYFPVYLYNDFRNLEICFRNLDREHFTSKYSYEVRDTIDLIFV